MAVPGLVVRFEHFQGTLATWDELFARAAEYATRIGSERLISISHSADKLNGVVTVWYWGEPVASSPWADSGGETPGPTEY